MAQIKLTIPGKPMGKQRPKFQRVGGFTRTYTPDKTVNYETLVKEIYAVKGEGVILKGALAGRMVAYFPIAKSASKKNRQLMLDGVIRPTAKPDLDNILKIIADALNGIAYHDDSQIVSCLVDKFYSEEPRVELELRELEG